MRFPLFPFENNGCPRFPIVLKERGGDAPGFYRVYHLDLPYNLALSGADWQGDGATI